MTAEQTAQALREIDTLAAEARRALDNGEDRQVACGYLRAIQMSSQAALRETLRNVNRRKLAAFDGLLATCEDVACGLRKLRDTQYPPFESATELSALWQQLRAGIVKTKT